MKTKFSGAKYSAIVSIGEALSQLERDTGERYLRLNRGVPSVCNIDLTEVIPQIDFNAPNIQVYPANSGQYPLKKAIDQYYFNGKANIDNIFVTAGGMNALDLIFKTLDCSEVFLPEFYWGAYANILKINDKSTNTYYSFDNLIELKDELKGKAVVICDPNNPLGNKYDDEMLLELVKVLNDNQCTIIWDSPYRKLFYESEDDFYAKLLAFDQVIIAESFSKSMGLSGQRLGFIHTKNLEFNTELNTNILYATNGINGFAQVLVEKILTTKEGQKAAKDFRQTTIKDMQLNIEYLRTLGILAEDFYQNSTPIGIFTVVKISEAELLKHKIGSVGLYYFTKTSKKYGQNYARLCIAVPHQDIKNYFEVFLNQ